MTIKYGKEARHLILKAIEIVAKTVKTTLGGGGRTVMIESPYTNQKPDVTKDGVTVAKSIESSNKELALGINFIKEVAVDTNNEAGDGTTTSVVLAEAFANVCGTLLDEGINPRKLKEGFDNAVSVVVQYLQDNAISVRDNTELLKQVAITSANNDEAMGALVYDAFEKVNFEGLVQLSPLKNAMDGVTVANGTRFPRGFVSPVGMNNIQERMFDFENCNILITDHLITDLMDFQTTKTITDEAGNTKAVDYNVLNDLADASKLGKESRAPLLILCDDMETAAVVRMSNNIAQGYIKAVVVKCPDFGTRRDDFLSDLALSTGGKYISTKLGHKLSDITMEDIGSADLVNVTRDFTFIKGGRGDQKVVDAHVQELISQLDSIPKEDKPDLEKRIAKITGGIAEVTIGANSTSELGEKRDRAEDAINAVRAAYLEGIVAGGGTTLLKASKVLSEVFDEENSKFSQDVIQGAYIVIKGLKAPFITILRNAGYNDSTIEKQMELIVNHKDSYVYNVIAKALQHLDECMIIDPAKVTRCALQNAASVVGTLITTDCIVYRPEKPSMTAEDLQMV